MLYVPTEAHKEPPPMTSNPDQFPNEDLTTKMPHAGGSEVPEDVRERPVREYRETPLRDMQDKLTAPDNVDEGFIDAPLTAEEHARLNPNTQPKNRNKLFAWVGGVAAGAAGIALAVGGLNAGATGEDKDKNGSAGTQPTVTAPVTPGAVAPTETAPTPEVSAAHTIVNESNVANYIKDYDEFVESTKVTHDQYKDEGKAFRAIVGQINNLLNIQLTDEEFEASQTLKTEDGKVGPEALAAMKRDAYDELLPDARFKAQFDKISESNFKYWMETRNEENPFKTEFVPTGTDLTQFKYINNAGQGNSLKPIANADIFRFYAVDPTLLNSANQDTWSLNPGASLVKEGTTANQR